MMQNVLTATAWLFIGVLVVVLLGAFAGYLGLI
jgi:hypothetical protein